MPWPCRLVPAPGDSTGCTPWAELRVGDIWLAPYLLEPDNPFRSWLAPKYWALPEPRRAPLVVRLPGPTDFIIDCMPWTHERRGDGRSYQKFTGDGWTVSGEPPLITLAPSINCSGSYHGFLQNGVISEDVEGRRFDADGRVQQ